MGNPAVNADYQIATYASGTGALVTLATLGVSNPKPVWRSGVSAIKLGDNSSRTLGAPVCEWRWGFLSAAERDILRGFIPGASAHLYIITITTEKVSSIPNASQRYECQGWWPDPNTPESPDAGRRLDFSITFKQLVGV